MILADFHDEIARRLKERTQLKEIYQYPSGRALIDVPCGVLELNSLTMGTQPGTEELALRLTWNLRILIDSNEEQAAIKIDSLMIEAALALYLAPFDRISTPIDFEFGKETPQDSEAFTIGRLNWTQEAHFGESVWACDPTFIKPKKVHVDFTVIKGGQKC